MIASLAALHERLNAALERMLGQLREMTEAQRSFKPDEPTWSPLEVSHHLLLAQSGVVDSIEKNRGRASRRRRLGERLKHRAVRLVLKTGIRVKNPAPSAMPDPTVTADELERRWGSERERLRELLEQMDAVALDEAGFKHPISGPLTVAETLTFLADHVEHHLRQLDRIRAHPDFPR